MKNTIRTSLMAAAVLALASMGAYAQNHSTTTLGLTATVSSFDNITASGLTTGHAVNCSVTSNDIAPIDVTVSIPTANPLTGVTTALPTLANTLIEWSPTSGGTYAYFASLVTGSDGAIVAKSITIGDATPVDFYLKLNVPAATPADVYSATLTVAITPHV